MMLYSDLATYYRNTFALVHHHKYSLQDIEQMIPFELDIYMTMIRNFIEEQEAEARKQAGVRYGD